MDARLLVIAGLAAGCSTRSTVAGQGRAGTAAPSPAAPTAISPTTTAPPRLEVTGEASGADVAALVAALVTDDAPPETIHGQVIDAAAGDAQPGVVIVATSVETGRYTAVTDEYGEYELALPAGHYELAFYLAEHVRFRHDVAVADDHATALDVELELPGRTFETALGAAAGAQDDDLPVVFSDCGLENVYYVDGTGAEADHTGM